MNEMLLHNEDGQNIWDLALSAYGSIEGVFNVVKDNSMDFIADPVSGQEIKFQDNIKYYPFKEVNLSYETLRTTYNAIVEDGQNIWDLSIQEYGAIDQVFNLFKLNPLLNSMNAVPLSGDVLTIFTKPVIEDYKSLNYFRGKRKVNTGGNPSVKERGGIGYMRIQGNFIVS
jgi:hypothetical protein